jgi:hypothetical protein
MRDLTIDVRGQLPVCYAARDDVIHKALVWFFCESPALYACVVTFQSFELLFVPFDFSCWENMHFLFLF